MQDQVFTQITQNTVEAEILSRLREAIVGGKIELGSHLREAELARQMNISRIPIREALRKLEQEGLVNRYPNRGCFVITFTEQDIQEVFSLRASLESMAFEWALPNMTPDDVTKLKELVQQQETAIKEKDYDRLTHLDIYFHEYICRKANHARLLKSWFEQQTQAQILLNMRFRFLPDYTPETVPSDHIKIIEAIENKDLKFAVEFTKEISERVSQECIDTILELQI